MCQILMSLRGPTQEDSCSGSESIHVTKNWGADSFAVVYLATNLSGALGCYERFVDYCILFPTGDRTLYEFKGDKG
jgi:hypothetical protein